MQNIWRLSWEGNVSDIVWIFLICARNQIQTKYKEIFLLKSSHTGIATSFFPHLIHYLLNCPGSPGYHPHSDSLLKTHINYDIQKKWQGHDVSLHKEEKTLFGDAVRTTLLSSHLILWSWSPVSSTVLLVLSLHCVKLGLDAAIWSIQADPYTNVEVFEVNWDPYEEVHPYRSRCRTGSLDSMLFRAC